MTVTGDESLKVEGRSDKLNQKEILRELRNVYGKDIQEPTNIFYSRWSRNRFTRGSYPNVMVGTTSEDFDNLQGSVRRLYFAGDATSEDWWGFAQAAYHQEEKCPGDPHVCIKGPFCPKYIPKANVVQAVTLPQYASPRSLSTVESRIHSDNSTFPLLQTMFCSLEGSSKKGSLCKT
ncbi:polyamine oxidase 1-like [Nematostella vectensis]|uniref:polyamine oxidase 1-like n=1 Tax=Nematostella vectensis TaxID=45351 RepID=UPI0020774731|nr:polyamine oxidase 1-like [Nematostella vectensis]XP_048588992.1 polyamine oxidase 1-like [Nematostella vectensis]XP_048588993.1 polyamine oxidase 1-like [Nematostella vectensis]